MEIGKERGQQDAERAQDEARARAGNGDERGRSSGRGGARSAG